MAIDELIKVERQIDEILLVNRFGVTLENEHRVIAFTAGKIRRYRIPFGVHVEMTPNNPTFGQIVFCEWIPGQSPAVLAIR